MILPLTKCVLSVVQWYFPQQSKYFSVVGTMILPIKYKESILCYINCIIYCINCIFCCINRIFSIRCRSSCCKTLRNLFARHDPHRPRRQSEKMTTKSFRKRPGVKGNDCGSVGRAVASNSRDPRFDTSRRKIYIEHWLSLWKDEKKKKRPGVVVIKSATKFENFRWQIFLEK